MKQVKEIWKKIDEFEDYEVSNLGNVRSMKYDKIKILKPSVDIMGYHRICLYKNEKRYPKKVHRLVASAFVPGYEVGLEVNHIDGNKSNNKSSNLEWNTRYENMKHAHRNGLYKYGKDHPRSKRIKVTYDDGSVQYFDNSRICADELGLNYSSLTTAIWRGRKHRGYSFQYI